MKKLQILGTGCPKCVKLAEAAHAAADQLGLECEIEKVTDINRIVSFGVMMTPALVVDGPDLATMIDRLREVSGQGRRQVRLAAPSIAVIDPDPLPCHRGGLP